MDYNYLNMFKLYKYLVGLLPLFIKCQFKYINCEFKITYLRISLIPQLDFTL